MLDLFAGSGALGIEALSRGASEAVFVDKRRARLWRPSSATSRTSGWRRRCTAARSRRFLKGRRGAPPFDLVFCDPPYDSATAAAGTLAELLPPVLTESALIVTESDKRAPLVLPFPLVRERTYGDTRLAVHRGS